MFVEWMSDHINALIWESFWISFPDLTPNPTASLDKSTSKIDPKSASGPVRATIFSHLKTRPFHWFPGSWPCRPITHFIPLLQTVPWLLIVLRRESSLLTGLGSSAYLAPMYLIVHSLLHSYNSSVLVAFQFRSHLIALCLLFFLTFVEPAPSLEFKFKGTSSKRSSWPP